MTGALETGWRELGTVAVAASTAVVATYAAGGLPSPGSWQDVAAAMALGLVSAALVLLRSDGRLHGLGERVSTTALASAALFSSGMLGMRVGGLGAMAASSPAAPSALDECMAAAGLAVFVAGLLLVVASFAVWARAVLEEAARA